MLYTVKFQQNYFNTHEYTRAYITLLSTTGHLWSGEDAGGLTVDQYKMVIPSLPGT